MCWMSAVTVLPRCAKGACWWAKSTAAVWSHTPWVKSFSIPQFSYCCPCQQTKKQKHKNIISLSLSCCFSSFFPLWSGAPGHSPAKASLCSWKNDLNNKLHTGLLRSSLFLAHLYKNPHSKKKKKFWRSTNSIRCMMLGQTLCQVALIRRHNWPSKLHKVIYEDRPRP